jgi:hypothetical protein
MPMPKEAEPATSTVIEEVDSLESLYDGPAVYANRCYVSVGPVVRLTFMEQQPTPSGLDGRLHFRTAVTLDIAQAVALSNIMKTVLAEVEKQIKEAEATARIEMAATEKSGKNV